MQLLGSNGQKLPTTVIRSSASEATVKLLPGTRAAFSLRFAHATGYGSASCPTSTSLEITPPNSYHSITVTGSGGQVQAYGGTVSNLKCGEIFVQPVVPEPA
jgi:hypothetical protein